MSYHSNVDGPDRWGDDHAAGIAVILFINIVVFLALAAAGCIP